MSKLKIDSLMASEDNTTVYYFIDDIITVVNVSDNTIIEVNTLTDCFTGQIKLKAPINIIMTSKSEKLTEFINIKVYTINN